MKLARLILSGNGQTFLYAANGRIADNGIVNTLWCLRRLGGVARVTLRLKSPDSTHHGSLDLDFQKFGNGS